MARRRFTPGPWHFVSSSNCVVAHAAGHAIRLIPDAEVNKRERNANGKLMAASPELLSALQAALVVMNHCYSISSGAELQAIEAAITATKIALLKAGIR